MDFIQSFLAKLTLIGCLGILFSSCCYRMPTENDYSLIPTTNNPAITCEKSDNILPSVKI